MVLTESRSHIVTPQQELGRKLEVRECDPLSQPSVERRSLDPGGGGGGGGFWVSALRLKELTMQVL